MISFSKKTISSSLRVRQFGSLAKDLEGQSEKAAECMILEDKYGAHNYHPVSNYILLSIY